MSHDPPEHAPLRYFTSSFSATSELQPIVIEWRRIIFARFLTVSPFPVPEGPTRLQPRFIESAALIVM